jgi:hypothetical protein
MVVTVDRRDQALRSREVDIGRAEVAASSRCRVEDVLRVGSALTDRANRVLVPGRWQELHGSDGAIECCIAVQNAMVSVGHCGVLVAVKQRPEDPRIGDPRPARARRPATSRVIRLDESDTGQHCPAQLATGRGLGLRLRRVNVGGKCKPRNSPGSRPRRNNRGQSGRRLRRDADGRRLPSNRCHQPGSRGDDHARRRSGLRRRRRNGVRDAGIGGVRDRHGSGCIRDGGWPRQTA